MTTALAIGPGHYPICIHMLPRGVTVLIVMGWLAATAWLFVRDLKPKLFPSGPPPFNIDLVDEARSQAATRWTVLQYDDQLEAEVPRGYVETAIRYHAGSDTFELKSEFKLWRSGPVAQGSADVTLRSEYHVTREGSLRDLHTYLAGRFEGSVPIELNMNGEVRDGFLHREVKVTLPEEWVRAMKELPPEIQKLTSDLMEKMVADLNAKTVPPTNLSGGNSVLEPMQPMNRLPGLRKGQRWSIPLMTSTRFFSKLSALAGTQVEWLEAEVLTKTQTIDWNDEQVECLVIRYEGGDEINMTQWVRASDGLVLQQEATLPYFGKLLMVRD